MKKYNNSFCLKVTFLIFLVFPLFFMPSDFENKKIEIYSEELNTIDGLPLKTNVKMSSFKTLKVGIIDVGITPHPNLNIRNLSKSWASELGHGTTIASIIGASPSKTNTYKGLLPGISIYAYNLSENFSTQELIDGIKALVNNNVKVINLSISTRKSEASLKKTIEWAMSHDTIFVTSSGNTSLEEELYPASYEALGVISVGSLNSEGNISAFSTYNKKIDFFFAGESILAIGPESNEISKFSGTSVAAPFITSLIVLVRTSLEKPSIIHVVEHLNKHTDSYMASWKYTNRMIDVLNISSLFAS